MDGPVSPSTALTQHYVSKAQSKVDLIYFCTTVSQGPKWGPYLPSKQHQIHFEIWSQRAVKGQEIEFNRRDEKERRARFGPGWIRCNGGSGVALPI